MGERWFCAGFEAEAAALSLWNKRLFYWTAHVLEWGGLSGICCHTSRGMHKAPVRWGGAGIWWCGRFLFIFSLTLGESSCLVSGVSSTEKLCSCRDRCLCWIFVIFVLNICDQSRVGSVLSQLWVHPFKSNIQPRAAVGAERGCGLCFFGESSFLPSLSPDPSPFTFTEVSHLFKSTESNCPVFPLRWHLRCDSSSGLSLFFPFYEILFFLPTAKVTAFLFFFFLGLRKYSKSHL